MYYWRILGDVLPLSIRIEALLEKIAFRELVSSSISCWANSKPEVLHEQPKADWSFQGWIFEADHLGVSQVRGKPQILEIYSHNKKRRVFPACSCLWGNSKFGEGLNGWWRIFRCWKVLCPRDGNLQFIFAFIADTRQGGIPSFDLKHSLPAKHRKILLKFIFCPSFHFAVMFLCLLSVPGYRESSRDINIDVNLGY